MEMNKNITNVLLIVGKILGYLAIMTGIIMTIFLLGTVFEI